MKKLLTLIAIVVFVMIVVVLRLLWQYHFYKWLFSR